MWNPIHLAALAVTLGVETAGMAAYAILHRYSIARIARCGLLAIFINLITHTLFWAVFPFAPWQGPWRLGILELLVTITEAIGYWKVGQLRLYHAFLLSLACNAASLTAGNLLWNSGLFF